MPSTSSPRRACTDMKSWRLLRLEEAIAGFGIMAAGGLVFASGLAFPVYTDPQAANSIKLAACDAAGHVVPNWWEELDKLETLRHPLMQAGLSTVLCTLVLLALWSLFPGTRSGSLQTPTRRWTFFGFGLLALCVCWFATVLSYWLDMLRGEFAWCADSMGIPIISTTAFYFILTPVCILVGFGLSSNFGILPVSLLHWDSGRSVRSWMITLAFAPFMALTVIVAIAAAYSSFFLVTPAELVILYLLASTRAALLANRPTADTA